MLGRIFGFTLLVIGYVSVAAVYLVFLSYVGLVGYAIMVGLGFEKTLIVISVIASLFCMYWILKWFTRLIDWVGKLFGVNKHDGKSQVVQKDHVPSEAMAKTNRASVSSGAPGEVLSRSTPARVKRPLNPVAAVGNSADFVLKESVEPVVTEVAPQPILVVRDLIFKGHYLTISRVRPEVAALASGDLK